jgi:dTDP-4-dehydrorhamnose reductase
MILILGGSGYVGSAYRKLLEQRGTAYRSVSRAEVDYTDTATLIDLLKSARPEFLINCAGYTGRPNVDACEDDKAECLFGNAVLPGRIADACEQAGVPWGHISSGCIYTGSRADGSGFTEADAPNFTFRQDNCSWYSGTKGLGEEVLAGRPNVFIWRIRIPFNQEDGPRNYITKLLRYDKLLDARNSLSHLDEAVAATLDCWTRRVPFGTYNVTNPGSITTREVVELIRRHGLSDKAFSFFKDEAEFMATAARTPRSNCVLDSSKLKGVGISLTEITEAVSQSLENWVSSYDR